MFFLGKFHHWMKFCGGKDSEKQMDLALIAQFSQSMHSTVN